MKADRTSVRWKLTAPLAAVLLPLLAATVVTVHVVDARLTARIESDLQNTARLEAARIESALDHLAEISSSLAAGEHVTSFVLTLDRVQRGDLPRSTPIGGVDGFARIDIDKPIPFSQLAREVLRKAQASESSVHSIGILDRHGKILGIAPDLDLHFDRATVIDALGTGAIRFAPAYRDAAGVDHLPVAVPIASPGGAPVGLLVIEFELGPVLDLVMAHEGLGETSEAHLAQRTPEGGAIFITPLRFERGAAFTKILPGTIHTPMMDAIDATEVKVLHAPDYRSEQSILAIRAIERTSWTLVVKVDSAETLAPVSELRTLLLVSVGVASLLMVTAWILVINPLIYRLRDTAAAANLVASGELNSRIDDPRSDEIGIMAASIDRLAEELALDKVERSKAEAALHHRATHDQLTGIANRQSATDWLEAAVAAADRSSPILLFCDLDDFKGINDSHGHHVGDVVLRAAAGRLVKAAGPKAFVARWGGDEFLIGLSDSTIDEANALANRLRVVFDQPVKAGERQLDVRLSIGIGPGDQGGDTEICLRRADASMYQDKRQHGRRMHAKTVDEASRRVRNALDDGRIVVLYQPIVELRDGREPVLCSLEALARLDEGGAQLLGAGEFIEPIESSPLGIELDRHVLRTAITQLAAWKHQGLAPGDLTMSVNLSPASLRDRTLSSFIEQQLFTCGVAPRMLVVEISERCLHLDPLVAKELQEIGVQVGIDDFGVLSSNLDRLVDIRTDVLKLDRRWVGIGPGLTVSTEEPVLLAITALCRSMGIVVVAEGVETKDHETMLRRMGVTRAQGFRYDLPLAADEFAERYRRARGVASTAAA